MWPAKSSMYVHTRNLKRKIINSSQVSRSGYWIKTDGHRAVIRWLHWCLWYSWSFLILISRVCLYIHFSHEVPRGRLLMWNIICAILEFYDLDNFTFFSSSAWKAFSVIEIFNESNYKHTCLISGLQFPYL